MAPIAVSPTPVQLPLPSVKKAPNGQEFENTCDAIEDILLYEAQHPGVPIPGHDEWNSKSKFDSEKDKEDFRKYEDAAQSVKDFYKEQHEKQ